MLRSYAKALDADIWDAAEILRDVLETRAFAAPGFRTRSAVT